MRSAKTAFALAVVFGTSVVQTAQYRIALFRAPLGPLLPQEASQCAAFAVAWNQEFERFAAEHEACLQANKAGQTKDSEGQCSRKACQQLHDVVYGAEGEQLHARMTSEIQKCNADVAAYQKRIADDKEHKQQEVAQQRERDARRAEERAEADRARAARAAAEKKRQDLAEAARQAAERSKAAAARAKAADAAERKRLESEAESARRVADRSATIAALAAQAETDLIREQQQKQARQAATDTQSGRNSEGKPTDSGPIPEGKSTLDTRAKEAAAQMADPFGKNTSKQVGSKDQSLANPFGPNAELRSAESHAELRNPFDSKPKTLSEPEIESVSAMLPAVNKGTEAAQKLIETRRDDARRLLNGSTLRRYLIDVDTVEAVLKGTNRYFSAAEYGILLHEISKTDGTERMTHVGEFIVQATKDLASTGLTKFGPRLIGERAVAVLQGAAAWAAVPAILLTPEPITREPAEIIRDRRTSLREKQEAVSKLWQQYERYGSAWQPAQKLELAELSGVVYRQGIAWETQPSLRQRH